MFKVVDGTKLKQKNKKQKKTKIKNKTKRNVFVLLFEIVENVGTCWTMFEQM